MTLATDKVIYLDMDGVIADFIEGFINVHQRDDLMNKFKADEWPTTWNFDNEFGPEDQWWDKVDAVGEVYWEYLNAYSWSGRLITEIELTGIPWYICTTPRFSKSCLAGKFGWLEHHVGTFQLMMIKDKWRLAHENALLIDDADVNCNKFHKAGGQTCIFPQPWNKNRDLVNHRFTYFKHCLETFASGVSLANV